MRYRPEIDGLRAIAVIPVILYHAGFAGWSGGFIGVDVFFVISGYLIASLILQEQSEDRFSLAGFYERRARRILPALFLVIGCSIPPAIVLLQPDQLRAFADSTIAVVTFSSNLYFWQITSDYFAATAEKMPLLHTWSLAVEEQYYLLFPLLMIATVRWRTDDRVRLLALAGIASLIFAEWASRHATIAAFYVLPSRAFELLAGALIAMTGVSFLRTHKAVREVAGLSGLGLIGLTIYLFDDTTRFPGTAALLPVLGTGLVIVFSTPDTLTGRLLGCRFLVGIGLISYSAYLWHQPLFAFARAASLDEPGIALHAILIAATFCLAFLSWRFVEMPFRNRHSFPVQPFLRTAIAASLAILVLGGLGHYRLLEPVRPGAGNAESYSRYYAYRNAYSPRRDECWHETAAGRTGPFCVFGNRDRVSTVIAGDSHAAVLADALGESLADARNEGVLQMTGCAPVRGYARLWPYIDKTCLELTDRIFALPETHPDIDTFVFSAKWDETVARMADGRERPLYGHVTGQEVGAAPDERVRRYFEQIRTDILELATHGKTVIFVLTVPYGEHAVPQHLSEMERRGRMIDDRTAAVSRQDYETRNGVLLNTLVPLIEDIAIVVEPAEVMCNGHDCPVLRRDIPLYFDSDHLSLAGSAIVAEQIVDMLTPALMP